MDKTVQTMLQSKAALIRRHAVAAVCKAQSGHPGGSLSIADILAVLYFKEMNIDPQNPKMENRDRFVLSKGHAAPAYYAALGLRGFFPVAEMENLRQATSFLQGHPDMRKVPGVDISSGSLGQGLSAANGMALSAKAHGQSHRVYCVIGDGESQEGQVWEATMTAAHYKLDNVTLFLDYNGLQIDGAVAEVMGNAPYEEKFRAFGWHTVSINGNDVDQIAHAIDEAKATKGRPTVIVAKTTKGKGVDFMENQCAWHGAAPKGEQMDAAMAQLDAACAACETCETCEPSAACATARATTQAAAQMPHNKEVD